jgi:polygalacturonase
MEMMQQSRFRKRVLLSLLLLLCAPVFAQNQPPSSPDSWSKLPGILAQIQAPVFPKRDFDITRYGAVGDGRVNCGSAIEKAITACHQAGGGRVVVPPGNFLTGPIYLKSNVELHLEAGARLSFSTEPNDYLPLVATRWEGVDLMNYSPLVYAYREHNIAITGEGVLDGRADATHWWPWKGKAEYGWVAGTPSQTDPGNRPALFAMSERNVPQQERRFGPGFYLRPQFIQPYQCENVLIEGVTVINSPMWILHPVLCQNVTIRKVRVESEGPNTDGCDPESCKNVLIKDCYFNTGDDCIAIKSGRNADGRRLNIPSENIVIQGCTMANGHGGIVIGSEISGGVKNVFAENCRMNSPLLDRMLRIKTSSARGGTTDGVYLRNISVGQVKQETILITMFYEDEGQFLPAIRNIEVAHVRVEKGGNTGVVIEGYRQGPVADVRIRDLQINEVARPYRLSNVTGLRWEQVVMNGQAVPQGQVKVDQTEPKHHW